MSDTFLVNLTCSATKHPAVGRFVWTEGVWNLVGASRQRPGTSIPAADGEQTRSGQFGRVGYPGCPSCGSNTFVRCGSCSRLGCYDDSWAEFQCPSCGIVATVGGVLDSVTAMSGG